MKVYMKEIKMIASFSENGMPTPIKFQLKGHEEPITIRVDRITERNEEKLAGNRMLIYRCESMFNGMMKQFELKYEVGTCRWYLFKL